MNYEFLSEAPEKVALAGGMYIMKDNWVCLTYPGCTYLVFNATDSTFLCAMTENDCNPGDETYTADLNHKLFKLENKASGTGTVAAFADIDRDGEQETFYLDKSHMDSGSWVTLRVYDGEGTLTKKGAVSS